MDGDGLVEHEGQGLMPFWLLVALAVPAGLARAWKACGLRPFPWTACGLRFAHRRRSGAFRPLPACPHPFHGAPGRTGPAGLPTGFPHPRPSAGDRFAFSTRPAAGLIDNQQQHRDCGFGRAPPSLPQRPLRNAYWNELTESSLRNSLSRCQGQRCRLAPGARSRMRFIRAGNRSDPE